MRVGLLLVLAMWCGLCGCAGSNAPADLSDIGVVNNSATDLYVKMGNESRMIDFGTLTAGAEAGMGGVPFVIGGEVRVAWTKTLNGPESAAICDTKPLVPLMGKFGALRCTMSPEGRWELVVYAKTADYQKGPELTRLRFVDSGAEKTDEGENAPEGGGK